MRNVLLKGLTLFLALAFLVPAGAAIAEEAMKETTLKTMSGKDFKLSQYKGKKALVLSFVQSSCSSCRGEMKYLAKAIKPSGDGHEFLLVYVDMQAGQDAWKERVATYVKAQGLEGVGIIFDPNFELGPQFEVTSTPALVVIDKEGKTMGSVVGYSPSLTEKIGALLQQVM